MNDCFNFVSGNHIKYDAVHVYGKLSTLDSYGLCHNLSLNEKGN